MAKICILLALAAPIHSILKGKFSNLEELDKEYNDLDDSGVAPMTEEPRSLYTEEHIPYMVHGQDTNTVDRPSKNFWVEFAKLREALAQQNFTKFEYHVLMGVSTAQAWVYNSWIQDPDVKTICEVGFGGGHSALMFLMNSSAQVYEFDNGVKEYSRSAAEYLQKRFPDRLNLIWGDAKVTMPEFHKNHPDLKCDLAIIDGGYTYDENIIAARNFMEMINPDKNKIAMVNTPCTATMCRGPHTAWNELSRAGCVARTENLAMANARGISWGFADKKGCEGHWIQ